jgi:hypothetical protein
LLDLLASHRGKRASQAYKVGAARRIAQEETHGRRIFLNAAEGSKGE